MEEVIYAHQLGMWLKAINPELTLSNDSCHFQEAALGVRVSLYLQGSNGRFSVFSPIIGVDADNQLAVMERALRDNADSETMLGCCICLIDDELVLYHQRDMNTLDDTGFVNLLTWFVNKSLQLSQAFSSNNSVDSELSPSVSEGALLWA